jgi:signal transduction histidine kinase
MFRRGPLLKDVLQRERERVGAAEQAELDQVLETLTSLKASLALPIKGKARRDPDDQGEPDLLGALFIDDERLLEPFSREEVALFEAVVAQAATTIQNSAVYDARRERERLAALGEMSAGLAHEIRNPLGAIKGAVLVLDNDRKDFSEHTQEFFDVIVEEVDRLNRVVSQFLTYSRPFKGEMSPVDLSKVIASTLRLLPDDVRESIALDEAENVPEVRGDADALRQVLHNLVLNALDAVSGHDSGRVGIELSHRPRGLLRRDAVALTVWDNGPGLSAQTMTNLFVPFHTTKTGGTGLGLPISQRIVENHHGVIEVGNMPDGGARFTVLLPAPQPEAESTEEPSIPDLKRSGATTSDETPPPSSTREPSPATVLTEPAPGQ